MDLFDLERKFCTTEGHLEVRDGAVISGYASLFGKTDQGGDAVQAGAYGASLARLAEKGRTVKMLWQHDPTQPIGVWDTVFEDDIGLYVEGRLLTDVARGREAVALIEAGAIDGLSIGYRTRRAEKAPEGGRILHELDLWEVSLVTFPMLAEARVGAKADPVPVPEAVSEVDDEDAALSELAGALEAARLTLAGG